ncbi:MAG: hypothetical protein HQK89_08870 [Nitrospirae bacterium]|nr:hypothetical protein [Nitrospirota bacterium]
MMRRLLVFIIFFALFDMAAVVSKACEEASYNDTSMQLHVPVVTVDSKSYYAADLQLKGSTLYLLRGSQAQSLTNGCQSSFDSKTLTLSIPFIPLSGKYYSIIMKAAADYSFPLQNITPTTLSATRKITIGKETGKTLRQLTGVNTGPYASGDQGNPPLDTQYKQIGVTMVRTHGFEGPFDMYEIYHDHTKDPNDEKSFNFTNSDVRYRSIANNGHELYLRVGDGWNNPTPPEPEHLDNYVTAMVNVVRHYKSGKWNGYTGNIRYVEIWNEPDGAFWPGYTMDYFTEFYIKAAKAIKAAFPDLKVGGPGFAPSATLTDSRKTEVEQFVSKLASSGATLDFLSWHLYTNTPNKYTPAANYYRTILNKYGYVSSESHITEWNTQTNGDTTEDTELRVNAKGAAINTAAWIVLQLTDVTVSTFFRGTDTSMDLTTFFGLFKADGSSKKVALAFSLWSKMLNAGMVNPTVVNSAKELSTTGGDTDFFVLAGKSTDGKITLLVANTASAAVTYSLDFDKSTGLSTSNYSVEVSEVSDASDVVRTRAGNAGFITMGGYSVNLVTLTP